MRGEDYIVWDGEKGRSFFAGPCRRFSLCNWLDGCHHREHSGLNLNGPCVGNGMSSDL
jgi:hypothetical protein